MWKKKWMGLDWLARGEHIQGPSSADLPGDPGFSSQWHLRNTGQTGGTPGIDLNVTSVWNDYTGRGVRVGVIDDGFDYRHTDLAANYDTTRDYDFRAGDSDAAAESGDNHGTTVAGVIAADENGSGAVGVAYDATIVGARIGYGANGSVSQIADAIRAQADVDISNNSWGHTGSFADNFKSATFVQAEAALEYAVATGRDGLGTVFVFAAGNNRTAGDDVNFHNFQNSIYTTAVAALDDDGRVASFSTPGAAVLVAAPGVNIYTTDATGSAGYVSGNYAIVSGTSFAAPAVSGVVALMLEANPELGYRDVQEILAYSARQASAASPLWKSNGAGDWNGGGLHYSPDYGFGLVDAQAAVRLAETWGKQSTFANMASAAGSATPNLAIPDGGTTGIASAVSIGQYLTIDKVEIDPNISHTWIGDLRIVLVSPTGTESVLVDRPGINPDSGSGSGSSADNINFVLSSNHFWGEDSAGTWTLKVYDLATGETGKLNGWSLKVYGDAASANDTYVYTDEYAAVSDAARKVLLDDAGNDTINAAAVTGGTTLNLAPGSTSTIAGKMLQIGTGTVIENAYLGDGHDTVIGNDAGNMLSSGRGDDHLYGNGGDDLLTGGQGDDTIDGGAGFDTAFFAWRFGDYSVWFTDSVTAAVSYVGTAGAGDGTDMLTGIDSFSFSDVAYSFAELFDLFGDPTPVNRAPQPVGDTATTAEDQAVTVAVLGNDADPDGDSLTVTGAGNGAHGSVTVNVDGTLTYAPDADFNGQDSFGYTISDGKGGTASAQVTVSVTPVNDAPVATDDSKTTAEDQAVAIAVLGNDSDVDGDGLTVTGAGNGTHGSVTINADGTLTCAPDAGFSGDDSFSYTVADGKGGSATALVSVTVVPATAVAPAPWSPSSVVFGNETSADGTQLHADSYSLVADEAGTVQLTGDVLDIAGVDPGVGVTVTTAADGAVDIRLDGAWSSLRNVAVQNAEAAGVAVHGFVHADVKLGGDGDSTVIIAEAKRGNIATGGGDDAIDITAYSDRAGSDNLFRIATGDGDNTVVVHGYGAYTNADVDGGDGNDVVSIFGSGAALLDGGAGDDLLSGGDGNDTLAGGTGADRLIGGRGGDIYVVDDAGDVVDESVSGRAGGVDLVRSSISFDLSLLANVENLTLTGAGDIDGTGNALRNLITGNDGANRLDGGAGADTMDGGRGDDTYVVNLGSDKVVETLALDEGGGTDTVESSISWSLANLAHVENLTLIGTANRTGTGNALDNILVGNSGNNSLDGRAGNDSLFGGDGDDRLLGGDGDDRLLGGPGSDRLTGGAGRDMFEFRNLDEAGDRITDFATGAAGDVLKIDDLFQGLGDGEDPFAGGFLEFQQSGRNTIVRIDADGGGDDFHTLVTLSNVVLTEADSASYVYAG